MNFCFHFITVINHQFNLLDLQSLGPGNNEHIPCLQLYIPQLQKDKFKDKADNQWWGKISISGFTGSWLLQSLLYKSYHKNKEGMLCMLNGPQRTFPHYSCNIL